MLRLAIIADDLTGALDTAAPFAGVPGGVVVATRVAALEGALARRPGVVAVSTRSREIGAAEARAQVVRALACLPPGAPIFKKIDSRLKGNIPAELEAFGGRALLVAPAIPEFGRVVRDGRLEGFGVDAPIPVGARLGAAATRATVPDTLTDADLSRALGAAGDDTVHVGARGLATALAAAMGLPAAPVPGALPAPLCMAIGSADAITLRQVDLLRRAAPCLLDLAAPGGRVPSAPPRPAAPLALLRISAGEAVAPAVAAARFAAGVRPWLAEARALVLSGGATAEACLDALGLDRLALRGEILPGLPLSGAEGRAIVTKSGGFGDPDCLARIAGQTVPAEDPAHG